MPGLVESIPSGSRLPQKDVAPTTNQPDDNVQSKKTKTLSPFEMLANAITSKLYSKGHLDVRVESMDVRIPYPSFLKSKDWTSVIASLRGSVLKLVPDDGKGHPEHFVIIGSSIEPIILEQDSNRAALRLKITTPYEILSIVISCDSFQKRKQWMTAFFWSTWERTRLDEVHTANILKNVVCVKDSVDAETVGRAPTTLGDDGRLEGYVSAQVGNQMPDCGKMWMTVGETTSPRSSKIFARSPKTTSSSPTSPSSPIMPSGPAIRLYSSHKGKGRKSPLITVAHITQAYIGFDRWGQSKSKRGWIMIHGTVTLAVQGTEEKPDGYFGFGASPDSQEGWIAIEPDESRTGSVHNVLDWLIAIHDSYGLYGRPDSWSWNKSNPNSLVFGLPTKAQLQGQFRKGFLNRKFTENLDTGDNPKPSFIREQFQQFMTARLNESVLTEDGNDSDEAGNEESPFADDASLWAQNVAVLTDSDVHRSSLSFVESESQSPSTSRRSSVVSSPSADSERPFSPPPEYTTSDALSLADEFPALGAALDTRFDLEIETVNRSK